LLGEGSGYPDYPEIAKDRQICKSMLISLTPSSVCRLSYNLKKKLETIVGDNEIDPISLSTPYQPYEIKSTLIFLATNITCTYILVYRVC